MRRLTHLVLLVVVASIGLTGCADAPTLTSPPTAPASAAVDLDARKDAIINEYVTALQQGDSKHLLQISDPHVDAKPVITQKITAIGNQQWTNVHVTWPEVIAANSPVADISATGAKGQPITDHVALTLDGTFWRVVLGQRVS